jgi:hypothetical protein
MRRKDDYVLHLDPRDSAIFLPGLYRIEIALGPRGSPLSFFPERHSTALRDRNRSTA